MDQSMARSVSGRSAGVPDETSTCAVSGASRASRAPARRPRGRCRRGRPGPPTRGAPGAILTACQPPAGSGAIFRRKPAPRKRSRMPASRMPSGVGPSGCPSARSAHARTSAQRHTTCDPSRPIGLGKPGAATARSRPARVSCRRRPIRARVTRSGSPSGCSPTPPGNHGRGTRRNGREKSIRHSVIPRGHPIRGHTTDGVVAMSNEAAARKGSGVPGGSGGAAGCGGGAAGRPGRASPAGPDPQGAGTGAQHRARRGAAPARVPIGV